MTGKVEAPFVFFAPFVSSVMRVEPGWIDYNGHLNVAYYSVLFDRAVDECYALIGIGEHYAKTRDASLFAAEARMGFRRELKAHETVRVTLQLLDFDEKRLRYFMELRQADEGWLAATSENLSLHVDMTTRRVIAFPDDVLARLALMKASHARLPTPEQVGQGVSMRPPSARPPHSTRH